MLDDQLNVAALPGIDEPVIQGIHIERLDLDLRGNAPIDHVVFPPLGDDIAYGRSPDGGPTLTVLPYATPGAPNP